MMLPKMMIALLATCLSLLNAPAAAAPPKKGPGPGPGPAKVQPFTVDLSKNVPHMLDMIRSTRLPTRPEFPGEKDAFGIDLEDLRSLRDTWLHDFDWKREQVSINRLHHYTVTIEGLKIHFIHEKSDDAANAIPLMLCHGWPGSFLEFIPVIEGLKRQARTSTGRNVSFNVIIPSLPGFAFSSAPPQNWTLDDTARVFNTLMTEVLGYEKYAVHGTSHGVPLSFTLYDAFNTTARAAHFVFMPFYPIDPSVIEARNITLTPLEQFELQRSVQWGLTGNGYFIMHTTKPNTVGLAMYDNPIGQLAWMGEKYIDWSDPNAGNGSPSVLTPNEILRCVSLYYLTRTFKSSMYTYAQDPGAWEREYRRAKTDAPLLVSFFKYNVGFWPREIMATVGNLTEYRNHDFGGNFAGLDNPPALIDDLREIGTYW